MFPEGSQPADVQLGAVVALKPSDRGGLGDDSDKTGRGFIDCLLPNDQGVPFFVLEAEGALRA